MKKLLSLCLTFVLLASCVSVTYASETSGATLVYDMSLTGSAVDTGSGQTLKVTDESGAGYVDTHAISTNQPVLKETGFGGKQYLEFAYLPSEDKTGDGSINDKDLQGKNRSLKVKFKKDTANGIDRGGEIADFEEMTIEMWAKIDEKTTIFSNMFSLGVNGGGSGEAAFSGQVNWGNKNNDGDCGDLTFYIDRAFDKRNGTANAVIGTDDTQGQWAHIVITREWLEISAPEYDADGKVTKLGTGQWKVNAYVNGVSASGSGLGTGLPATKTQRLLYEGGFRMGKTGTVYEYTMDPDNTTIYYADTLAVGGNLAGEGFACDIGDFKIYKGIRTADEIAEAYLSERTGYMAVPDVKAESIAKLENMQRDEAEFDITFDYDVDSATVNAESIYIEDESGNKVGTTFKGFADNKASFELTDFLRYNTKYYLCMPGVKDLKGEAVARKRIEFTSAPKKNLKVTDVSIVGAADGKISGDEVKITLKAKNTDATNKIKVGMMVMIYKDGRAIMPIKTNAQELAPGAEGTLVVSTKDNESGILLGEGYMVRSFAYSEENGYIGFSTPIELIYEQ